MKARAAAERELLCLHRHAQDRNARTLWHTPAGWTLSAHSQPLHDASGHRGALYPRRAGKLHDLQGVLESAQEDRGRPALRPREGNAPARSFVELHEHSIATKVAIMVDHFVGQVAHRIGGKAKAMIVTRSRLHAVRYKLAVDTYLQEKGLSVQGARGVLGHSQGSGRRVDYTEAAT